MSPEHPTVKSIVTGAKMNLKIGPELMPTFFIGTDNGEIDIVVAHLENERAKNMTTAIIKEKAKQMHADFIIFVSESYILETKDKEGAIEEVYEQYGSIKNHPDAKEVVTFSIETKTSQRLGHASISEKREMGEIQWMEPTETEGRFSNILGEKPTRH